MENCITNNIKTQLHAMHATQQNSSCLAIERGECHKTDASREWCCTSLFVHLTRLALCPTIALLELLNSHAGGAWLLYLFTGIVSFSTPRSCFTSSMMSLWASLHWFLMAACKLQMHHALVPVAALQLHKHHFMN